MSNCQTKGKIIQSTMTGGKNFVVRIPAMINNVPYPLSDYAVKIELRLDGEGGELLATWTDADPEVTFNDTLGEVILTVSHTETSTLTNDIKFDRPAYLDFLLTKVGSGLRSATLQVNPKKGITV